MSNNKSKIVISILSLAILGFFGYGLCRRRKSLRNTVEKPTENSKNKIRVNDIIADLPKSAEELLYRISKEEIEKKSFIFPEEFLTEVIHRFIISCTEYSWFEEMPTTLEELEQFLKDHGLFGQYYDEIKNKDRY